MIGICKNCSKILWKFLFIDGRNIYFIVLIVSLKVYFFLDLRKVCNVFEVIIRLDYLYFVGFLSGFVNENL